MSEQSRRFYEFGSFSVHATRRLLLRNGAPIPLEPKVLETLIALVENPGRILTKDELLKQVWGDTIVEEGGLTRNISILRKALGERPGHHEYIVTAPGRGYQFVAHVRERLENGDEPRAHLPMVQESDSLPYQGESGIKARALAEAAADPGCDRHSRIDSSGLRWFTLVSEGDRCTLLCNARQADIDIGPERRPRAFAGWNPRRIRVRSWRRGQF